MRTQSTPVPAPTPWRPPKEICGLPGRLLVVSHSLPLHNVHNRWRWRQSLEDSKSRLPAPLRLEGGLWIGWSGPAEEDHGAEGVVATPVDSNGDLRDVTTVLLDRLSDYDPGPAMQTLWPVLHGLPEAYDFDSSFWPAFERLNDGVAHLVGSLHRPDDRILVTDPRLARVGEHVRRERPEARLGLSLQVPFPPPELFFILPHADRWLGGLLAYDVVAFRCPADRDHALACLRRLHPNAEVNRADESDQVWFSDPTVYGGRPTCLGVFPEDFDACGVAKMGRSSAVEEKVRQIHRHHRDRRLIFSVDPLDPVRGIPHKIRAFGRLLDRRPDLLDDVVLVQRVEPWYPHLPCQAELLAEVDGAVGEVNGRHGYAGRVPVQYLYRPTTLTERLAYHQAADVTLVTPIRDACCSTARELCAAREDGEGALVMSELCEEARHVGDAALCVNPLDEEALTATLERALELSSGERNERMGLLRSRLLNGSAQGSTRKLLDLLAASGSIAQA